MIELVVNGTPFTDFTEVSATVSLTTLSNDFSFTASSVGDFPPLKQGDKVVVLVDRAAVLTGHIDEVTGTDKEGDHVVTYSGRDLTGDLVDSHIDTLSDIRASESLTLQGIIEIVLDHIGLDVDVINEVPGIAPFNAAEDLVTPRVGQAAWDLVSAYARKRQAILTSSSEGDIVITQSEPVDSGAVAQRLQGAPDNNILSQRWGIDHTQLYNRYLFRAQLDPRALNFSGDTTTETVEDQNSEATDADARPSRQFVKVETESYSASQLKDRAKWASQLAKARATTFSCVLKGHAKPTGGAWAVNTLVQINSDVADISRKMLIDTLTYSQAEGAGSVTTLDLVERNVYTVDEKILSQKPTGSLNDAFKSLG